MKKIKITAYILAILWIGVLAQYVVNVLFRDEHRMVEAFAKSHSEVVKSEVTIVGTYGAKYLTTEDKKTFIQYMAGKLGLDVTNEIYEKKGDKTITYGLEREGSKAAVKIQLISVTGEESQTETKQYIYADIMLYKNIDDILDYKKNLENILDEMNTIDYDTSIKFQGSYEGALSRSRQDSIAKELTDYLQGSVVTQSEKEDIYTLYAYTSFVDDSIKVDGDKINMNIVFDYDESQDKTYLYLATPILNEDY